MGLLLVAAVVGLPSAGPAQAAPGRCAPGTGVTVVVDFGSHGRGVQVGCDGSGAGDRASQVVPRAGFRLTYLNNGQPFVCRIEGVPTASDDPCNATPPEDAYWALYWSDGRDGRWVYSSSGVASLEVPEGGSIGFRWQSSNARVAPGLPPTTGAAAEPTPTRSPAPTPKPTPPAPAPSAAPGSPSAPAGTPSATAEAAPTSSARTGGPRSERRERAAERAAERASDRAEKRAEKRAEALKERRTEREAAAEDEQVTSDAVVQDETPLETTSTTGDGGGALTWVAGGAVLLLAAAAGVLARRRRG